MLAEASWKEFQESGLLWWVNRTLHLFGWAITFEVEADGSISHVYPARCKFRGFDTATEVEGFQRLTSHIDAERERLLADVRE